MATYYDWDELEDNIVEEYDENGNTIAEYTTKPELYGDVISQHRNGVSHFFKHDAVGNTTEVTDINGNVTDTRQYTAFGEITESTGTTEFPFEFIGQKGYYRDEETGIYLVRWRVYDQKQTRWTSVDPLGFNDGTNVYSYCLNRPNSYIDATGLAKITCGYYCPVKCQRTTTRHTSEGLVIGIKSKYINAYCAFPSYIVTCSCVGKSQVVGSATIFCKIATFSSSDCPLVITITKTPVIIKHPPRVYPRSCDENLYFSTTVEGGTFIEDVVGQGFKIVKGALELLD